MTGMVLFAHGSRLEAANEAVRAAAQRLRDSMSRDLLIETAFLELGSPDLPAAVETLIGRGVSRIVVVPYFLTTGRHVERDLPELVRGISTAHPGLSLHVTPPLDGHPALLDAVRDRALEALR